MYKKYPRTFHLPFSEGVNSDDKVLKDLSSFEGKQIVVTLKMDGENTSMYNDHIHARSLDSRNHVSRNWVKNFWSQFAYDIPEDYRICGENLYAKHTITYEDLPTYFLGFSVWNKDTCLGWDETIEWFDMFNIIPVKQLYRGQFDLEVLTELTKNINREGYVVRKTNSFTLHQFQKSVAKFVSPKFKPNTHHWMYKEVEINKLCK